MAIYFFAVAVMPCCEENCVDTKISHEMPEGNTHDADHCLPFCTCSCCNTQCIAETASYDPAISGLPVVISNDASMDRLPFSSRKNIWQPPRNEDLFS
jgi:hypothetical protein